MIKRLIDVGVAVKDLDAAVKKYSEVLDVKPSILPPEHYAYPGLKGARFRIGEVTISLVASEKADGPVAKFLETRGEGLNHISLEVTDIEQDIRDLAGKGVKFASDRPLAFSDGEVIFAHPKSLHGVQIAFVQAKPGTDLLTGE
ncbi:MAG: methylmalonyl-CoA epimerase [Dehalococcoidia bacterium]|nr:MAG: methylmalonyl-CoA epimerase [Dehalococcoidia bacterium]